MRRTTAVAALLVVVGVGLALSGVFAGPPAEDPDATIAADSLVAVEGEYQLWPYTSRDTSVAGRTLAINVVFRADAATTRRAIEHRSDADWEETTEAETAATGNADQVRAIVERDWADARSSTRYSYVRGSEGGIWMAETFELHDGSYLGVRDHLRAYESPDGAYTAVQAHEEYYDWFRLRHTVPGIDEPKTRLENELIRGSVDAEVTREYRGIDGGWSDGWLTIVDLASAAALAALGGILLRRQTRRAAVDLARRGRRDARRHARAAALGVSLALIVVGVRATGVAVETLVPTLPPKAIAAPLYLVLAVGLPGIVVALARRCDPSAAALAVAIGLGVGFVADFAALGVAIPPALIVHRVALIAALGVVSLGRAADGRPVLAAGAVAWAVGLVLPLADVI
ncbi:hypothetical protein [Halorubrum laminariae]|uniref:DUF2207 domain-containing protein n=1 Tax=Halorubrum laminariae TaxID=1433523 RepID=A0ABD6C2J4_9EURY|nr:hypothetical protein [Halorubrum laminariae]